MALVALLSVVPVVGLVGAVWWEETINPATGEVREAGLPAVGATFLTEPLALFVAPGALLAAATTVTALFTGYSRTVLRAARDELVPGLFAVVHEHYNTPSLARALGLPLIRPTPIVPIIDETVLAHIDILEWLVVVVVSRGFLSSS